MACSIEDTQNLDSVQTLSEDEIRRVVRSMQEDLTQFKANNEYLCNGLRARMVKPSLLEDNQSSISATMSEFFGTMSKIWEKIEEYRSEGRQLDQEIHALQEEKDILEEEECSLINHVEEETGPLYRKLKCLIDLKDTSQTLKITYQQEWSKIKEDMKNNYNEARRYERELQNLQNMAVLKMSSLSLNSDNKQDQEILELITYLEMKRDMRDLNEDTLDLQAQSRDFENDLTELQETRKELLEENYALDPEEEDEPGVALHRTGGRTDLCIRFDKQMDKIATGSGGLLTRLRARMGIQAHSGTSLRPKVKADAAPRRFSLKDSAKAFIIKRQRINTPDVSDEANVSDGSDVSNDVTKSDIIIEIPDDQQQKIDSKKETKKEAISKDTMDKLINESDLPDKQMDEIATGSGGLLTKLRARMGIQAHSGTSLRPKVKAEAAPRRFSLRDSSKAFITKRQRRNTPDVSDESNVSDKILDDQQQVIDSKKETKAISKDTMEKLINESDLPDKQMGEIATGSGGLLTKLRARMGIQAHSGTSLRPKVKVEAAPRRFSLKDSAKAFFTKRQRINYITPSALNMSCASEPQKA